jgi:hypothetical protein
VTLAVVLAAVLCGGLRHAARAQDGLLLKESELRKKRGPLPLDLRFLAKLDEVKKKCPDLEPTEVVEDGRLRLYRSHECGRRLAFSQSEVEVTLQDGQLVALTLGTDYADGAMVAIDFKAALERLTQQLGAPTNATDSDFMVVRSFASKGWNVMLSLTPPMARSTWRLSTIYTAQ